MMPYCISSAALPVTKGVAIDEPVFGVYPPPGAALVMSTPGAARSGFGSERPVNPCPENEATLSVLLS